MYNNKIDKLTDYPFPRLANLLENIKPNSLTTITMAIGAPIKNPPNFMLDAIIENENLWNRYPPTSGSMELKIAITEWAKNRFNLPEKILNPEKNVFPICGTREALSMSARLCIPENKNGKKPAALIPNPFYQVYSGSCMLESAENIFVSTTKENNFLPDYFSLDEEILERAAICFLCTPSNPQGSSAPIEYLKRLIKLARKYDFVLASDECYSEIYYTSEPPAGALQACAELAKEENSNNDPLQNVIVFNSLSKRSNAPGLRSGFVAGSSELISKFLKLREYGGAVIPLPLQAASTALWSDENHVVINRNDYINKMNLAAEMIGSKFEFSKPDGGFYLWLNVGDGEKATQKLWAKGLKVLPGKYLAETDGNEFNPGKDYIRAALVNDLDTTQKALEILLNTL
ncbi:MAG: aminotransferase class I/II-fold pyridoxal phosphate-dependent enzyme [Alphaproteobacteria bacterium]|nr:aminotransferase class I/II-fold pyridoxal phosphate-dependent enzyme [Alphaproteobacteria bacterium]